MTEEKRKELACALGALSVFRGILKLAPAAALLDYLKCGGSTQERIERFGAFVYSLSDDNYSLSDFLCRAVYADENRYIIDTAQKKPIPAPLLRNAKAELSLFSELSACSAEELCEGIGYTGAVPQFASEYVDFTKTYSERLANIGRYGYGVFSEAKMFRVEEDGEIVAVRAADDISEEKFVGYESERKKVFDNTRSLMEGRPAANVLLFGDAGTGKSSTVKACVNRFAEGGVRLIELRKNQLFSLSRIMDKIADNPLKFIIFIDDLSFNKNDDSFSMLKAALEGSTSAKAGNAVIYATSNRRHIVKENFSDRGAEDDVHHSDTVQELMSLSDRFGLTVYFERPNKALYLDIVHKLADKNNINIVKEELDIKAEAFALNKGSRSPRAAEQFIDSLK